MNTYEYFHKTHIGSRPYNEDAYQFIETARGCSLVLADGCGGHEDSFYAAQYFCDNWIEIVKKSCQQSKKISADIFNFWVTATIHATASQLIQENFPEARTTFTAVWLDQHQTFTAYVGDTRIYIINPIKGSIWHTSDHSVLQALITSGLLDKNSAKSHPARNRLLKAIGTDISVEPSIEVKAALNEDEILLLCTDGFWEHLDESRLYDIAKADKTDEILDTVFTEILNSGKELDNLTVQTIRLA